jgi:glycosyltransferase involved in cell wall biosynthesis
MVATDSRIVIFIRSLREGGGGAQRAMVRFANGLQRRGYVVTIAFLLDGKAYDAELDPAIRRVTLGGGRLGLAVPALAAFLRRERPDTLFTTEPASNVICVLAKLLSRVPARVVIREGLYPSIARRVSPYRATRMAYALSPFVYRFANDIIAIASDMASDLARTARVPRERITTITVNPVVTPELLAAAEQSAPHPWLQDGGPSVILGVGRLTGQKDFANLIAAFAAVRSRRRCRLLIIGEGGERAKLEALARETGYEEDIALPGFLREPFGAMRACDVFVLSSRYEGLPNVLIEALACRAAVVATDCPSGPRDVLLGGELAPLVPVGDADALAHAIDRVLDNPPDREILFARAMDFTVERSLDCYLPVLFR